MKKVYLATREELNNIVTGGSVDDGTPVGRVVFDYVLRDGYVKANGATVVNASINYPRLVTFIQVNKESTRAINLAAWEANKVLYLYDESTDTLTLPDYTGLVMQGADIVSEVQAGLPNITGQIKLCGTGVRNNEASFSAGAFYASSSRGGTINPVSSNSWKFFDDIYFNASNSSAIYGKSTTVQPHAAGLIPQIRY